MCNRFYLIFISYWRLHQHSFSWILLGIFICFGVNSSLTADIKRLDGKPILFDTLNGNDVLRVSGNGLGINKDATQALDVSGNSIISGNLTVNGTLSYSGSIDFDAAAVFNDSGAAVDFRVEGDTDENLLYIDALTDNIGVGNNTPTYKLDVSGNARVTGEVALDNTLTIADVLRVDNSTDSTSTNTGSIQTDGGLGVAKDIYGGGSYISNSTTPKFKWIENDQTADEKAWDIISTASNFKMRTRNDADDSGTVWLSATRTGTTVNTVSIITGSFLVDDTTNSTSTITGSIQTDGGMGVAKDIYIGSEIKFASSGLGITTNSDSMGMKLAAKSSTIGIGIQSDVMEFITANINDDHRWGYGTSGSLSEVMFLDSGTKTLKINDTNISTVININEDGSGNREAKINFYAAGTGAARNAQIQRKGGSNSNWVFENWGTGEIKMIPESNGVTLLTGSTAWAAASDYRLKRDIVAMKDGALEKLEEIFPSFYQYKSDTVSAPRRVGVIAQDVLKVLPEAVGIDNKNGMMSVRYQELIPLLIKGVKELNQSFKKQNALIREQMKIIEELKRRLKG